MPEHSLPNQSDFKKWRSPRRGQSHPERMDNPFWEWCIRTRESAYAANEKLNGPDSHQAGPCWCFDRMGQASVTLPDGREVFIAGEHEDHYDPDFYIYNDVVVVDTDGEITIWGYPEDEFPPTDFHSATVLGKEIILIGNLGYPDDRQPGTTQILKLNTTTWKIERVSSTGESPGWIHSHQPTLSDDGQAIRVTGGIVDNGTLLENIEDYELDLSTLVWTKLTDRNWNRYVVEREDGQMNDLFNIRMASWDQDSGLRAEEFLDETLPEVPEDVRELMKPPEVSDEQTKAIATLYQSPVTGEPAKEDEENFGCFRYAIDDVTVRYNEDMYGVTVTFEGDLTEELEQKILEDLQRKLADIESSAYKVTPLSG